MKLYTYISLCIKPNYSCTKDFAHNIKCIYHPALTQGLLLSQLDMPCLVDAPMGDLPLSDETDEDYADGGIEWRQERTRGKKGGETEIRMLNN